MQMLGPFGKVDRFEITALLGGPLRGVCDGRSVLGTLFTYSLVRSFAPWSDGTAPETETVGRVMLTRLRNAFERALVLCTWSLGLEAHGMGTFRVVASWYCSCTKVHHNHDYAESAEIVY